MPSSNKYKLAIIMRTDLGMTTGKMCVQAGHASVLAYKRLRAEKCLIPRSCYCDVCKWFEEGQFKVVLKCPESKGNLTLGNSELTSHDRNQEDVLEWYVERAKELGLPVVEVRDKGFTQVKPETLTCIAIGLALCEEVDKITRELKLL